MYSWELDNLKNEVQSLKWQKAEAWQLQDVVTKVIHMSEKITRLENEKSYLEERIFKLENLVDELNCKINSDSLED